MELDPQRIGQREKLILFGLYLSKYDSAGLKRLGFETFTEAFNVIGYALGSKPASIKNYRDEFDPIFPNRRKGWHKRETRMFCLKVLEDYKELDLESFTGLVKSLAGYNENMWSQFQPKGQRAPRESNFAQRLLTGVAAERYFESVQPTLSEFTGYRMENTTQLGCGYDFRLQSGDGDKDFLAVEVKGLREESGTLALTRKEHEMATALKSGFFLFVVKNFRETPFHEIFQNPLSCRLQFKRVERIMVQHSWVTKL
jgi:Protein NO VEIN, C-terminal